MKKFFSLMAIAIAAVSFTACSDSDSDAILSVDPSVSEGIVAELDGGFYQIPVTADKDWTVRLEDGCDWASLMDVKGKGSGSIEVCVDANYTGFGRKTNVLISSGDKTVVVPISQRTPDTNDGDYYNIAGNKGLGFGFDMSTFSNGQMQVFNLKAINKLMEQDDIMYDGMYNADVVHNYFADEVNVDSIEDKKDSLGIELRFNINYGLFHLGVKAKYVGKEERKTNSKRYKVTQSLPMLKASISYNEIMGHYRDWVDEGCPKKLDDGKTNDYRGNLLQNGFRKKLNELEQSQSESDMMQAAQDFYSSLGPALIARTTLGGSVAMQLYVDSVYFKEVMALDTAHVDVAFKSGLFSLDAEVNVGYKKEATEHLKHSVCEADIHGGSGPTSNDLYAAFKAKQYEKLDTLFHNWTNSLVLDDNRDLNTTSIIDVDLVPIWVLVDKHCPARAYLRNYILQQLKAMGNQQLIDKFDKYPY